MIKYYFISHDNFNERYREMFGINYFLDKGHQVVVLDVTAYTHPNLYKSSEDNYKNIKNLEVHSCKNMKDFKKHLLQASNNDVGMLFLGNSIKEINIRRYLKKVGIKIGLLRAGLIPHPKALQETTKLGRLKNAIQYRGIAHVLFSNFAKLYIKLFEINSYDFLITSNYKTYLETFRDPVAKNIFEIHSSDYDKYLELNEDIVKKPYVVFIDQYLSRHEDYNRRGEKHCVTEEKYFSSLNSFFDQVEKKYNVDVVIAQYPVADKEYIAKFQNRQIVSGQTNILTKYAKFVIMHYSTAINYVILYDKSVYFIKTDELRETKDESYIDEYANLTGQTLINIDQCVDIPVYREADQEKYFQYMQKYIKKLSTPKRPLWDIFYQQYIEKFKK